MAKAYQERSSLRGGTRVGHLANKQMKKLLHMAALSVVSGKGEMAGAAPLITTTGK